MCDVLQIPRSSYYYQVKKCEDDARHVEEAELQQAIYVIFKKSRDNYSTRKIK